MRHYFTLLRHELWKLFINPSTYIAAFLFLLIMGFMFKWLLDLYATEAQDISPSITFFKLFFIPVFFMVPLLTMRSVAEERSSGTIETLMTTPVTATEVILSKFTAGYLFYMTLWILTASFHLLFFIYAQKDSVVDPYPILGGYLYIAISGILFLSLGIFASSLTSSQLVAGIVSFTMVFGFIVGGSSLNELVMIIDTQPVWLDTLSQHTDSITHMSDFSAGIIDSRAFVLYISSSTIILLLSILVIEYREGGV